MSKTKEQKPKAKWRCSFYNATHTTYGFFLTLILYFFVVLFLVPVDYIKDWEAIRALKALSYLFVFSFTLTPTIMLLLLMTHTGHEKIKRRPYLWQFIGALCAMIAASLFFWPGKFM